MGKKRIAVCCILWWAIANGGCTAPDSGTLGVQDGRLAACPSSPNCVSSRQNGGSAIAPFRFSINPRKALLAVRACVVGEGGAKIIAERGDYLHATFTSPLLRFVDDVEFYLPEGAGQLEVRSASRVGWWDMGANRRRVERLRQCAVAPLLPDGRR